MIVGRRSKTVKTRGLEKCSPPRSGESEFPGNRCAFAFFPRNSYPASKCVMVERYTARDFDMQRDWNSRENHLAQESHAFASVIEAVAKETLQVLSNIVFSYLADSCRTEKFPFPCSSMILTSTTSIENTIRYKCLNTQRIKYFCRTIVGLFYKYTVTHTHCTFLIIIIYQIRKLNCANLISQQNCIIY